MKRLGLFVVYCSLLAVMGIMPLYGQAFTINQPSRAIHIVYDDSGSMIIDNEMYLDRWVQAKYAMEVFAAMLQENDTMRIYYMSDFIPQMGGNKNAPPRIVISGTETAAERVAKIHDYIPNNAHGTPFDPVIQAYNNLKDIVVDDKWLVVLTDGVFNRIDGDPVPDGSIDVDEYFYRYVRESNVKIIYLAIGDDIAEITADPNRHIYYEHARNSNEILGRITTICNRIFNRNILKDFSFDVPMQELLVFAQGDVDIRTNNINGDNFHIPSEPPVNVKYSLIPARNYANFPRDRIPQLNGVIAKFTDIPKGSYTIDIEGAQTVDVYYQPAVAVAIRLYQWYGKEIHLQENSEGIFEIPKGRYRVKYGLVDDNGQFISSTLIGNVEYEAMLYNGEQSTLAKSGNIIDIRQGDFEISVLANFLGINTAENSLIGTGSPLTIIDFLMRYWPIFLILFLIFLVLAYGPLKPKFPNTMARKPLIKEVRDGEEWPDGWGRFTINRKTLLPFFAQTGRIRVVPDEGFPKLKVKAKNKDGMILLNVDKFTPNVIDGKIFRLNNNPVKEGTGKKMEIPCLSVIETIYPGINGNTEEKYTCLLQKTKG
jgi:hypothetical protein